MAVLKEPTGGANQFGPSITKLAPKGTYLATVVDIIDTFGVERPKFEDPSVIEKVDLTIFVFGFKGKDGQLYLVKSGDMRISGNEKSKLYGFLQQLTGEPPKYGWDYCELLGKGGQITIAHKESKRTAGKFYAVISALSPVMEEVKDRVLPAATFASLLDPDKAPAKEAAKAATAPADDEDGAEETPF
jgi:hypothetical protein